MEQIENLQPLATGLGFPEGPVAFSDGSLLFVDIARQTLCRLTAGPQPRVEDVVTLPGGPNGLAIGPDGAAYVCNNGGVYSFVPVPNPVAPTPPTITVPVPNDRQAYTGGSIQRVDLANSTVTTLYTSCDGQPLLAPDDIVFDPVRGGFWFTDGGFSDPDNLHRGAIYFATIDGKTIVKARVISRPNGIGISPDGKTLYVADTDFGRLWAFEIQGPGQLAEGPMMGMPGKVVQTLPGYQYLDSLKVEAHGSICVGTLFAGCITVFSPDGKTAQVMVPDPFPTNLCFGGADMRDVWITASSTGTIYKGRWPRPGLKLPNLA